MIDLPAVLVATAERAGSSGGAITSDMSETVLCSVKLMKVISVMHESILID